MGFIKPIIREGFVDQDADGLIQRHIGEESCNVIGDQYIIFINRKVSNFIWLGPSHGRVRTLEATVRNFQIIWELPKV